MFTVDTLMGGLCTGIKIPLQDCAKNTGVSLCTRGEGRICGTLRYIGCIHIDFTDSQAHLGMFAHAQAVFGKKDSRQIYAMLWLLLE